MKEFKDDDVKLSYDKDVVIEVEVPAKLSQVQYTIEGDIQMINAVQPKKLTVRGSVSVNHFNS